MPFATGIEATTKRRGISGSPLDFSLLLQGQYEHRSSSDLRKTKGQFFTPPEIARFMASLFEIPATFRLLDPGAGIGSLSAAVCERICNLQTARVVEIHLFENDAAVLPLLSQTMEHCETAMAASGHELRYHIHSEDFILDAAALLFRPKTLFNEEFELERFDAVVMNPPYFKVSKDSSYARVMDDVVHGQPNMYAFFLAAAAETLKKDGQLVAITPRSFCNGLYFRNFRRWFFQRMSIERIHLFESRTDTFRKVLQESLVWMSRKSVQNETITLSTSFGRTLDRSEARKVPRSAVLEESSGDLIIRIPARHEDAEIGELIERWPHTFAEIGLRVSTGPVVTFRAREFLLNNVASSGFAPLLSVHNVKAFRTVWPNRKKNHPVGLQVCRESLRLLLPSQNYVLLRRFSAKEERRRLTASPILASATNQRYVALENHLNYVYHAQRQLSEEETYGLVALFNSAFFDRYFRTMSGNTQVNATELRAMKFPPLRTIVRLGKRIKPLVDTLAPQLEEFVLEELDVPAPLRRHLLKDNLFSTNNVRDQN